jgi:hypothetical protein
MKPLIDSPHPRGRLTPPDLPLVHRICDLYAPGPAKEKKGLGGPRNPLKTLDSDKDVKGFSQHFL